MNVRHRHLIRSLFVGAMMTFLGTGCSKGHIDFDSEDDDNKVTVSKSQTTTADPVYEAARQFGKTIQSKISNPQTTELHLIGSYEAVGGTGSQTIEVNIARTGIALVVALSSFQAVNWKITLEPGVTLEALIVTGPSFSTVTGVDESKVLNQSGAQIWTKYCAYRWPLPVETDQCADKQLYDKLQTETTLTMKTFQGCKVGGSFVLGTPQDPRKLTDVCGDNTSTPFGHTF